MSPEELAEARASVIERAIKIETLLDVIISQHYIGYVMRDFLFEVLHDEYFSFGLKVKIFAKITTEKSLEHKINRLGKIRNYFAHRGRLTMNLGGDGELFAPDPKDPSKSIDFDALYTEFGDLADALEQALLDHYKHAGGRVGSNPVDGKIIFHALESDRLRRRRDKLPRSQITARSEKPPART